MIDSWDRYCVESASLADSVFDREMIKFSREIGGWDG